MKKTILSAAVILALASSAFATDYYILVPNQGKDDYTQLTDIAMAPLALPAGKVGEAYAGFDFNSVLTVTGDPNYTAAQVEWSVAAGELPAGLTLNANGTLTGTPTLGTAADGQAFTLQARYGTQSDAEIYRVTVKVAIALASATPPEGIVGQPYPGVDLKPLVAVDGAPGFTPADVSWRLAEGHALPAGLTLNADGTITGTPSAAFSGEVSVVASYQDESAAQQYRFVTLALNIALANATAPQGIVGQVYEGFNLRDLLTVTGDSGFTSSSPVTWSVVEGALPAGLTLNASTGVLSGTPTAAASNTVTVRATYRGLSGEQAYLLVTLNLNVSLESATLPSGNVGLAYPGFNLRDLLTVTGYSDYTSSSPVSWSVASGTLPAGLTLNPSTGALSGTPTEKTTHSFEVLASYQATSGQQTYTIVVNGEVLQVAKLAVGSTHTCAVTPTGGAKCWGDGAQGQLGNNSTSNSAVPVDVSGLTSGVVSIAPGAYHTCAVTTGGGVKCWGSGSYGQLGHNSTSSSGVPVNVSGLTSGVASIASGAYHTCAVTTSGGAKCWGSGGDGRLGHNSTANSAVPVNVSGLTGGVASISAGNSTTCAVTTGGGAKCWGSGIFGQLGNNGTASSSVPVNVSGLTSGVASISAGFFHTCAVTTGGGAKCWGIGGSGQLGNNGSASSSVPVNVSGLTSGVASISAGDYHTCAVTTDKGAKCWGAGGTGALGNNSKASSLVPGDVSGLTSGVASISAGSAHTCAMTLGGIAKCWGSGYAGRLGDGTTTDRLTPVNVLR